jgi:hypothetical protein
MAFIEGEESGSEINRVSTDLPIVINDISNSITLQDLIVYHLLAKKFIEFIKIMAYYHVDNNR